LSKNAILRDGERKRKSKKVQSRERSLWPWSLLPDLVRVAIGTVPHLRGSSSGDVTIGQIQTLAVVSPSNAFIASNGPLLIDVVLGALPNLQLNSVSGASVRHIQAHVAENFDLSTDVIPRLRRKSLARLDENRRSVRGAHSGQTSVKVLLWADSAVRGLRSLRRRSARSCVRRAVGGGSSGRGRGGGSGAMGRGGGVGRSGGSGVVMMTRESVVVAGSRRSGVVAARGGRVVRRGSMVRRSSVVRRGSVVR